MSGPRLQSSLLEGFEDCGGLVLSQGGNKAGALPFFFFYIAQDGVNAQSPRSNMFTLMDLQDGRQVIRRFPYANHSNAYYYSFRYGLKTTTPNKYVVVTLLGSNLSNSEWWSAERYEVGDGAYNYSQETLVVDLPTNAWTDVTGKALKAANIQCNGINISKNIYSPDNQIEDLASRVDNGGSITVAPTSAETKYTFTFNEGNNFIFGDGGLHTFPFSLNMTSRKYATPGNKLKPRKESYDFVAKVWSPIKNCYCLKNFADGEIPILNE